MLDADQLTMQKSRLLFQSSNRMDMPMPMVGKWPRASMAMSYLELAIFFSRSRWEAVPKRPKRHESTRQLTNLRSSKLKEWMRVWAIKILTCKTRCWDFGTEMMVQLLNNLPEVINSSFHYDIMTRIIHLSIWKGVLRKIHEPNQKGSHICSSLQSVCRTTTKWQI